MRHLIDNPVDATSWEVNNCTIDVQSQPNAIGKENAANRVTQTLSGNFTVSISSIFTDFNMSGKRAIIGGNLRTLLNVNTLQLQLNDTSDTIALGNLGGLVVDSEWTNFIAEFTCNSVGTNGCKLYVYTGFPLDDSVSRHFDFSDVYIMIDSLNSVSFNPEYDFEENSQKIENRHRVRSGEEFVYKWGDYQKFDMGVSFVNSGFKSVINSYWNSNAELLFVQSGALEVHSVRLSNSQTPIGSFIKPYSNLFSGVIELETY